MIRLKYSTLEHTPFGCTVRFSDESFVNSCPHPDDHHYYVVSHRVGLGDDILAYCRLHEFSHLFVMEKIFDKPSPVLWALAHNAELSAVDALAEEALTQLFQRWMHANEEPIIAGTDWHALKREALRLIELAG